MAWTLGRFPYCCEKVDAKQARHLRKSCVSCQKGSADNPSRDNPAQLHHLQGSIYQDLWRFTKEGEQIDVTVQGNLRTNTSPVLVAAVLSGMGLAVLQEFTVRSALADGTLTQILPEYQVSPTEVDTGVYAVYSECQRHDPQDTSVH